MELQVPRLKLGVDFFDAQVRNVGIELFGGHSCHDGSLQAGQCSRFGYWTPARLSLWSGLLYLDLGIKRHGEV